MKTATLCLLAICVVGCNGKPAEVRVSLDPEIKKTLRAIADGRTSGVVTLALAQTSVKIEYTREEQPCWESYGSDTRGFDSGRHYGSAKKIKESLKIEVNPVLTDEKTTEAELKDDLQFFDGSGDLQRTDGP